MRIPTEEKTRTGPVGYQPIENYGVIGDLRTVALVGMDGSIDWYCYPNFDSPSVFAAILDDQKGGRFKISPVGEGTVRKQLYWPDTNVLVTRFFSHGGVGNVMDVMPLGSSTEANRHQLVRRVNVIRGEMTFRLQCRPAFDYARAGHTVEIQPEGASFGRVAEVGPNVTEFKPGDYVVATTRRRGGSIYDQIGNYDMTTDDVYRERGINLLHGFLTEYYVDDPEYMVQVPAGLKHVAALAEPVSVVMKGLVQATEIQRRLKVWSPRRAAVLGAGTIGLAATLILRQRGIDVTTIALPRAPYVNSDLVEALGARYVSTKETSLQEAAQKYGPWDVIFEGTGFSPLAFEAMEVLGKNGVLVLCSITGGSRRVEVPADKINMDFVLGNKVMVGTVNGNAPYFAAAVNELVRAEMQFPGWCQRLLTHPVQGLDNYQQLFDTLTSPSGVIKAYCVIGSAADMA
jgi:threonine dehydrogenase-like Zn-dependent dehydrogenase